LIRSQGIVIPRDFRATEKKPVILELAENIWDYVKDGKSLPGNVQIRTAPKTRLDLSLMFRKDVVLGSGLMTYPLERASGTPGKSFGLWLNRYGMPIKMTPWTI
jgi:hypothetical protein